MTHNPGSPSAITNGCTCAVLDNHHGRGLIDIDGNRTFWFSDNCPIHGVRDSYEQVEKIQRPFGNDIP